MARDRLALIHPDRTETFGSLAQRVARLGNAMVRLNVGHGERVAYLGPNHPAFVEVFFATASIGAVFVPLNTRLVATELAHQINDSGARVLFSSRETAELAEQVARIEGPTSELLVVGAGQGPDGYEAIVAAAPDDAPDHPVSLDDLALIMYTSGTTGRPKGAMLTHGNLTWNTYNLLVDLDLTGQEVTLVCAPLFHTAALSQTFLPTFLKGGVSVLASAFDPDGVIDLIAAHRVTYLFGVPTMFLTMAGSTRWTDADLSSLRILHCGGAPVPEMLIRMYQDRGLTFVQGYGLTEASPGVLLLRADESTRKSGSAGAPCFFSDAHIVDPDGHRVDPGRRGEIVVSGPNVMRGYWQQPAATSAVLRDGVWLHTGDVGVSDDDGFVSVVDRLTDVIISGGENVYPAEVEAALFEHPEITDCAVIPVVDEKWGEVGRAVIVLREGSALDGSAVLRFLDGRLARYKIPVDVIFAQALPRNPAGKLLRREIRGSYGQEQPSGGTS